MCLAGNGLPQLAFLFSRSTPSIAFASLVSDPSPCPGEADGGLPANVREEQQAAEQRDDRLGYGFQKLDLQEAHRASNMYIYVYVKYTYLKLCM